MANQPRPNLYHFGQRPDFFSLPYRVAWVVACSECAAAWLQPSYDYVKVQRAASEAEVCQICQYLASPHEDARAGLPVADTLAMSELKQMSFLEEVA